MKPIQAGHKLSESKIDKKREMASFNARKKGPIEIQRKTIQFVFKPFSLFFIELLPIMNFIKYLDLCTEKIRKIPFLKIGLTRQLFDPNGQV